MQITRIEEPEKLPCYVSKVQSLNGEKWTLIDFGIPTKNKDYAISNFGRIKRIKHGSQEEAILQGSIDNRGRKIINVVLSNGKYASKYIHHLVAQNFVEQPSDKHNKIIHLDYNPLNNQSINLKWVDEKTWKIHRRSNPYKTLYSRDK